MSKSLKTRSDPTWLSEHYQDYWRYSCLKVSYDYLIWCCFDWSFCFTHTKYLSVHYVLAVQNERDRISSRRNIPDSQELPPITILAQAESLSKQVRILLWSCYFPVVMFVCELMSVETLLLSLPADHCSGRNSRHIRAEVSQCWGCLWFYETTVAGFGGMGQIYSCLWRATTGWPGNRAVMHDCLSVIIGLLPCHCFAHFSLVLH